MWWIFRWRVWLDQLVKGSWNSYGLIAMWLEKLVCSPSLMYAQPIVDWAIRYSDWVCGYGFPHMCHVGQCDWSKKKFRQSKWLELGLIIPFHEILYVICIGVYKYIRDANLWPLSAPPTLFSSKFCTNSSNKISVWKISAKFWTK